MIVRLNRLSRRTKQVAIASADAVALAGAAWLAFAIRYGTFDPPIGDAWWLPMAAVLIGLPVFWASGLYREVTRYVGTQFVLRLVQSVVLVTLLLAFAAFIADRGSDVPRTIFAPFAMAAIIGSGGIRVLLREGVRQILSRRAASRVAIFGAGHAGVGLGTVLAQDPTRELVAFFDDDPSVVGSHLASVRVWSSRDLERIVAERNIDTVMLALPEGGWRRRREIFRRLRRNGVRVLTVPTFKEIADGIVGVENVREVAIGDLLGRPQIRPEPALLRRCIDGRSVLVTGAGGSIGSELCRQILRLGPSRLVLLDSSEFNLYQIEMELRSLAASAGIQVPIVAVLGSVLDELGLERLMKQNRVATVYHAAAYKHVPIVEANEVEGARTNVLGTVRTAQAARTTGVSTFVLVSTDKAVRPTSVMGATKRMAELVLQAIQADEVSSGGTTCFVMVRFGNVLGSSGSVVPLFAEQIRAGGPVTVTHPDVTRYFMTISEASELVLQAAAMGDGGDVFVFDMGEPVRIVDLASSMIELAGREVRDAQNPDGDIEIRFTGLRPGEKMTEELVIGDEIERTTHPGILRASERFMPLAQLEPWLQRLQAAVDGHDAAAVRSILHSVVAGYAQRVRN